MVHELKQFHFLFFGVHNLSIKKKIVFIILLWFKKKIQKISKLKYYKVFQKPIILIDSCSEFNADQKSSGDQIVIMSLFHCEFGKTIQKISKLKYYKVFQKPFILIDSCSESNADQKSSGDQNVIMSLF